MATCTLRSRNHSIVKNEEFSRILVAIHAVAAWPGGPGGAPTHLPLYDVGRHGHRRAPGGRRSLNFTVNIMYYPTLAQSSDLMVIQS